MRKDSPETYRVTGGLFAMRTACNALSAYREAPLVFLRRKTTYSVK